MPGDRVVVIPAEDSTDRTAKAQALMDPSQGILVAHLPPGRAPDGLALGLLNALRKPSETLQELTRPELKKRMRLWLLGQDVRHLILLSPKAVDEGRAQALVELCNPARVIWLLVPPADAEATVRTMPDGTARIGTESEMACALGSSSIGQLPVEIRRFDRSTSLVDEAIDNLPEPWLERFHLGETLPDEDFALYEQLWDAGFAKANAILAEGLILEEPVTAHWLTTSVSRGDGTICPIRLSGARNAFLRTGLTIEQLSWDARGQNHLGALGAANPGPTAGDPSEAFLEALATSQERVDPGLLDVSQISIKGDQLRLAGLSLSEGLAPLLKGLLIQRAWDGAACGDCLLGVRQRASERTPGDGGATVNLRSLGTSDGYEPLRTPLTAAGNVRRSDRGTHFRECWVVLQALRFEGTRFRLGPDALGIRRWATELALSLEERGVLQQAGTGWSLTEEARFSCRVRSNLARPRLTV